MADVKWIKIYTDMVSNKKIKRIRTLPEGNNIVLIWVLLLAQAGESNKSGALYLTDTLAFRPEDLAVEFDFEIAVINIALIILEKYSMIEVFDEVIYIKNWGEYQNFEGLGKIQEQSRLSSAKYRQRQKEEQLFIANSDRHRDVTVTVGDATELELDIELDIDKEQEYIPYREIVSYLNDKTGSKYKVGSDKTKGLIKTRWGEKFTLDDFKSVIDKKVTSWTGTDQEKFLRPETLFGPKFEGYVNERVTKPRGSKATKGNKDSKRFDDFYN